jgi:hypothetical protein
MYNLVACYFRNDCHFKLSVCHKNGFLKSTRVAAHKAVQVFVVSIDRLFRHERITSPTEIASLYTAFCDSRPVTTLVLIRFAASMCRQ